MSCGMQCWGMLEHDLERERKHYLFLKVFCRRIIIRKGSKKGKKSRPPKEAGGEPASDLRTYFNTLI